MDDDDIDRESIRRGFAKARLTNPIVTATDGEEALEVLRGTADSKPLEPPYIVLLDLNMPRMNGLEFLAELREDPQLRSTVVFVLTTSDADRDMFRAYDKNVAGYCLKSRVGDDFWNLVQMLDHYGRVVELPSGADAG